MLWVSRCGVSGAGGACGARVRGGVGSQSAGGVAVRFGVAALRVFRWVVTVRVSSDGDGCVALVTGVLRHTTALLGSASYGLRVQLVGSQNVYEIRTETETETETEAAIVCLPAAGRCRLSG